MFAQPISKPRFKALLFYQNSPKIKLFLQKNAKFSNAEGFAPRPLKQPPLCEFLATRLGLHLHPTRYFDSGVHLSAGLHLNSRKKVLQFW